MDPDGRSEDIRGKAGDIMPHDAFQHLPKEMMQIHDSPGPAFGWPFFKLEIWCRAYVPLKCLLMSFVISNMLTDFTPNTRSSFSSAKISRLLVGFCKSWLLI